MKLLLFLLSIITITLEQSTAAGIVSLAPAITEIVYYVGAGNKLTGNTIFCNRPEDAKRKIKVGDIINPDIETIISLKPDLVIATDMTSPATLKKLKVYGIHIRMVKLETLEDVQNAIKIIGNEVSGNGEIKALEFREKLKVIEERLSRCLSGKKFAFVVFPSPLYVAGKHTFISQILSKANGVNIFSNNGFFTGSVEEIVFKHPDIVFLSFKEDSYIENILKNSRIKYIKLNPDIFLRPSPYIIEGLTNLEEKLCAQ